MARKISGKDKLLEEGYFVWDLEDLEKLLKNKS